MCPGLLYDHGHLSRAVCCRLEHGSGSIDNLPQPYHVNHPALGRVTTAGGAEGDDASRSTQKTREHSVNWCLYDKAAELTDGTKGLVADK